MSLTEEQRALRLQGLGSSDVSAVVGENPFKTAHDVWLVKRGLREDAASEATWFGEKVEAIIAERYSLEMTTTLQHGPGTVAHPSHPWALATTDRETANGDRIVECKLVGQRVSHHWVLDEDGVPPYVMAQAQWQMMVRGIARCDAAVIFGGTSEFRIYQIGYRPDLANALLAIGSRFWHERVVAGTPPPIDETESAQRVLLALYPRHTKPLAEAPPAVKEWFDRRVAADEQLELVTKERDLASNKLRELIGDAEGIEGDFGRVTWKADARGVRSLRLKAKERKERAA